MFLFPKGNHVEQRRRLEPEVKPDVVVAIYDFDGVEPGDLSLRKVCNGFV